MGISLDERIDLYTQVDTVFNDEIPCEHTQHEMQKAYHEGSAKWYVNCICPACGDTAGLIAFCDKWKRFVSNSKLEIDCITCGHKANASVFYRNDWIAI